MPAIMKDQVTAGHGDPDEGPEIKANTMIMNKAVSKRLSITRGQHRQPPKKQLQMK